MRLALVVVLGGLFFGGAAGAQDLPTTHDHGITISPDQLTDAIQETQDYWGPVRKHLLGDDCAFGERDPRTAAVAFLKTVHDGLHDRLFNRTEAEALDLILFLGHRLRTFEVYRRVRAALGDDALTLALVETFQREVREINRLPEAERAAKLEALAAALTAETAAHGVTGERLAAAQTLWTVQTQIITQIAATEAGKMMIGFEAQAKQLNPQVGKLLLYISTASDWVLIVREPGAPIGREQFLTALAALQDLHAKQTAAGKSPITR